MSTTSMNRVFTARAYRSGAMGSLGDAAYMLLRQFQFPDTFESDEPHLFADHDRIMQADHKHGSAVFQKHTGTGELGFEHWLQSVSDPQVIEFLIDILRADRSVVWTGYRIMGSVHRGNGYPVFTLELFAKKPSSSTVVYTGSQAPNVSVGGSRSW